VFLMRPTRDDFYPRYIRRYLSAKEGSEEVTILESFSSSYVRPNQMVRASDLYYSYCRGTVGTPTKFGREHAFFDVTSDILTKIVSGTLAILAALIERAPSTKITKQTLSRPEFHAEFGFPLGWGHNCT
jgi:hypothetical protein